MSSAGTPRTHWLLALPLACGLLALSSRAQTPPAPPAPAPGASTSTPQVGGAGGDGAKAKQATLVIEETSTSAEPPPPAPVGEERAAIGEYIRGRVDDVQDCYRARIRVVPTLQGKLVARFDIGPSGKVIGATADGIQDTQLVACVVGAVRKWEFDKPASGGKLRVAYPFIFKPQPADR